MIARVALMALSIGVLGLATGSFPVASACCPVFPEGKRVVNADQAVIIIWDSARKIQHFIRKASFRSEADNFGFLVPTPSQPELAESDDEAFTYLYKLTEPTTKTVTLPTRFGCYKPKAMSRHVEVLEEKHVAGFRAAVLKAATASALVDWLRENGYVFSADIEAWAKPYVDDGWNITALRIDNKEDTRDISARALRMSFTTERPLFPYREPDPKSAAHILEARNRILRLFFLADGRYDGHIGDRTWDIAVWARRLSAEERNKTLSCLRLPQSTGPEDMWLNEFEHHWPYNLAQGDVFFTPSHEQIPVERHIIQYVYSPWPDAMVLAIPLAIILLLFWRWLRRPEQAA
jgi:hypothetical protein